MMRRRGIGRCRSNSVLHGLPGWRCLRVPMVRVRVRGHHATSERMQNLKELKKERAKTMPIFPRLRVFLFVLNGAAMLMTGQANEAQDRSQGRSMVISRKDRKSVV